MKLEKHSDLQLPLSDESIQRLYLIHHMHHFSEKVKVMHELHHCYLYDKTGMDGNRYTVSHKQIDDGLFHVVNNNFSGVLYDHVDNEFVAKNGIIFL